MNGLEHMVKACNRFWKEGKSKQTRDAAREGVSTIMACRQRSCFDRLYDDEMCEFCVFLALVTLDENESAEQVEAMFQLFSQASKANQQKTIDLFSKHGKRNFMTKLVGIFSCEYSMYHPGEGILVMETLLKFYDKPQIVQKYSNLRPTVVFIWNCLKRKGMMSADDEQVTYSARYVDQGVIVASAQGWSNVGKREFYAEEIYAALISLKIAEDLCHVQPFCRKSQDEIVMHIAGLLHSINSEEGSSMEYLSNQRVNIHELNNQANQWYAMGIEYFKKGNFVSANYYNTVAMPLVALSGDLIRMREINTNLAFCLIRCAKTVSRDDIIKAVKKLRDGLSFCDQKNELLAKKWKELGKIFFQNEELVYALNTYKLSIKIAPDEDKVLQRELYSNISLICIKLKKYHDSKKAAIDCINVDKTWFKGYWRLGISYQMLKDYTSSNRYFFDGLKVAPEGEESIFLVEIFKNRYSEEIKYPLNVKPHVSLLEASCKSLQSENTKLSWGALENLVMYSSMGSKLTLSGISIFRGIQNNISDDFLKQLIKGGANVYEVVDNMSVLRLASSRSEYIKCAILIFHGASYERTAMKLPCIIRCVQMIIVCGNVMILTELLKMGIDINGKNERHETALHLCCVGPSSESKIKIIEILIRSGIDVNIYNQNGKKALDFLKKYDPRRSLLDSSGHNQSSSKVVALPPKLLELRTQAIAAYKKNAFSTSRKLYLQVATKLINKPKYVNEEFDNFMMFAVSCIKAEEDYLAAFRFLCDAVDLHKVGISQVLTAEFGNNYQHDLHKIILSKCLHLQDMFNTALTGAQFLTQIVQANSVDQQIFCITKATFDFKRSPTEDIITFLGDNDVSLVHPNSVVMLAEEWLSYGIAEFERGVDESLTFYLVDVICVNWNTFGKLLDIRVLANIYTAVLCYIGGEITEANKYLVVARSFNKNIGLELFSSWKDNANKCLKLQHFGRSYHLFKYTSVLGKLLEFSVEIQRRLITDVAVACIKANKADEVPKHIALAFETSSKKCKEISDMWITIAKQTPCPSSAIKIYSFALKLVPDTEIFMQGQIWLDIAALQMKLKEFTKAITNCKKCLKICPTWSVGHFKLGTMYLEMGEHDEGCAALKNGLNLQCDESNKCKFLVELLKARVKIGNTYLKINVSRNVCEDVLMMLIQEDKELSWKAIENFILHTCLVKQVDLSNISLAAAFQHELPKKCIEIIIGGYSKDVSMDIIEMALEKDWIGICAKLIPLLQTPSNYHQTSAIVIGTKLSIKTGKFELVEKIISIPEIAMDSTCIETALSYCCQDSCSQTKIDIINALLKAASKLDFIIDAENIVTMLNESDPRRELIIYKPYEIQPVQFGLNQGTITHLRTNKKNKKKRKKRGNSSSSDGQPETQESKTTGKVAHTPSIWDDICILIETLDFDKIVNEQKGGSDDDDVINEEPCMDVKEDQIDQLSDDDDDCCDNDAGYEDSLLGAKKSLSMNEMVSSGPVDLGIDGMPWEVECTQEVWIILRNKKIAPYLKERFISAIKMLASGNWRKRLAKPMKHLSSNIRLYQARITKGCRMLWEMSISFSARCSIDQYESNLLNHSESCEMGAVYVDKIRIWNIALNAEDIPKMVEQILFSHKRGRSCLIQKQLKGIKKEPMVVNNEKFPNIYVNESYAKEYLKNMSKQTTKVNMDDDKYLFFPPANPNDQEYNILKFYAFTSAMASRVLSLTKTQFDFPFQVSELEHTIIHLEPNNTCAVLLLGRSGTGKTTCCLYRLFKHYQSYWGAAQHAGPHIPKFKYPAFDDNEVELQEESQSGSNESAEQAEQGKDYILIPCLCTGSCNCKPIYAPAAQKRLQSLPQSNSVATASAQQSGCSETDPALNAEKDTGNSNECDYEDLRQLLITKNEVLCNEIKKNFGELCVGCPNGRFEAGDPKEYADIKNIPPEKYPLFITSKDLLVLLDGSLDGTPFFERDQNGFMMHDLSGWGDNKVHLSFLPLVEDDQEDLQHDDDGDYDDDNLKKKDDKVPKEVISKIKEVTYDVFAHEIWPQIVKGNTGHCHPSLVWMEIKSFIKGSAESFLSENGYLSKEEYLNIGRKKAPNFTGSREDIYHMFLLYSKIKSSSRYFDEMDVHFDIYKRLKTVLIPEWAFHQVYVDETQDFTQGELLLLLRCSLNQNAMFFSGDTAQSIINGVSFRFCDLKSLFLIAKEEFERNNLISPVVVPRQVHQLTHNYRSHSGILKLASSIVRLLELLFPESFDRLNPDVGLFAGPKPVILDTNDFSELAMLLQGTKRKTSAIEFGAHQVVLVQNDKSKEDVPPELSYGLVLSIYEAKGLEFDDVLLYNFFKDSPAVDEWRVIASNIDNIQESEGTDCSLRITLEEELECETRALDFDYSKHKLLNSELKKLYTAITRARVNVWIFDEDKKKRAPIFEMFLKKNLVNVRKLEENSPEQRVFAERSSVDDWRKQGHRFYEKCLWKLAMKCFESGNDEKMQGKCLAQVQGSYAEGLAREWKLKKTQKLYSGVLEEFRKAAKMFLENSLFEEAKVCLKNLKEWKYLGMMCEKQKQYPSAALYYYKDSMCVDDAVRCFKISGKYDRPIKILRDKGRYLECLDLIEEYDMRTTDANEKYVAAFLKRDVAKEACKEFYEHCQYEDFQRALKYLSYEDQFNFLKVRKDCIRLLIQLYKDYNKVDLLIAYYLDNRMFYEASELEGNITLKVRYILMAVRQMYVKGCNVGDKNSAMMTIKVVLKELENSNLSSENVGLKFDLMYHMMQLEEDFAGIKDIFLHYYEKNSVIMELVCFQYWIQSTPSCISDSLPGVGDVLRCMLDYVKNVFNIINHLLTDTTTTIIQECFVEFGLRQNALNGNVYMVEDETRFLYFMKFSNASSYDVDIPKNGGTMNLSRVKPRIARILLKFLHEFISLLYDELISNLKHATLSLHTDGCYYDGCTVSHGLPTAVTFAYGKNLAVSLFELRALCQEAYKSLKEIGSIQKDVKWLDPVNQSTELLTGIGRFIFNYIPFLHVLNQRDFVDAFSNVPKIVTLQLISCIRQFWAICEERCVDINTYIKLSLLSYLFDRHQPVSDELITTSSTSSTYPKYKSHYNILLRFNQYLLNLYYGHHIVNACKEVCILTSSLLNASVKPTLLTVCELLEIPIMVLLISFSKLMSFPVYFPNALVAYKNFCELLYSREGQFGIDIAVGRLHCTQKENISYALQSILKLLVGEDFSNFNPIFMMSEELASFNYQKNESSALMQTHCERLLILYLVTLINLPVKVPGGRLIIRAFKPHVVKGKGKLIQVFNAISHLSNRCEAKQLLSGLLKMKNGHLVELNFHQRENILKSNSKAPNNTPGIQRKIMSRKVTENKPDEAVEQTKELVENILKDSNVYPVYSNVNEKEDVGEINEGQEENTDAIKSNLSIDLNDNAINNVPLNVTEISDLNEAEFVEDDTNMLENYALLDFDGPNVSEKDNLNEDLDEHFNAAKIEKERKIKESMTATYIQHWWKNLLSERRILTNKKEAAASRIQLWWKKIRIDAVKNVVSPSILEIHEKYFNSKNVCIPCDTLVDCKEDHLCETSEHHKMAESYEKFLTVTTSICQLHESYKEYEESHGTRNVVEVELALSVIMSRFNVSERMKRWGDAEELEVLISRLMTKINEATDQIQHDEGDEFQEIEHKQKRNIKRNKKQRKSKNKK